MSGKCHSVQARTLMLLALGVSLGACSDSQTSTAPVSGDAPRTPSYTAGVGFGGGLLGRASIPDGFKLKRKNGKWDFEINAKDPTDVSVQNIAIAAGGTSGWHSHPGPVLLQITSGSLTFYESHDKSCSPRVLSAGQVFIETGDDAHITRNETGSPATALAVVFSPPAVPLRIDEAAPGNCPF